MRRRSWPGSSLRAPVRQPSQSPSAPTRSAPVSLAPAVGRPPWYPSRAGPAWLGEELPA